MKLQNKYESLNRLNNSPIPIYSKWASGVEAVVAGVAVTVEVVGVVVACAVEPYAAP
jgi:hypothetical protein